MSDRAEHPQITTPAHVRSSRGFTLIELLVVIGIMILLMALLLPAIRRAWRQADRSRRFADIQAIGNGLENYRQDFQDYPRPGPYNGAATLCKALLGPGGVNDPTPAYAAATTYTAGSQVTYGGVTYVCTAACTGVTPSLSSNVNWVMFSPVDGNDGLGFRLRAPVPPAVVGSGRVYGPYLQPDKFRVNGMSIVDSDGNPILYYTSNYSIRPTIYYNSTYAATAARFVDNPIVNTTNQTPMWDASQNSTALLSLNAMRTMMGDTRNTASAAAAPDGWIDPNISEQPAYAGPYILWSAGPDRIFGPVQSSGSATTAYPALKADVGRADDVTNFTSGVWPVTATHSQGQQ